MEKPLYVEPFKERPSDFAFSAAVILSVVAGRRSARR